LNSTTIVVSTGSALGQITGNPSTYGLTATDICFFGGNYGTYVGGLTPVYSSNTYTANLKTTFTFTNANFTASTVYTTGTGVVSGTSTTLTYTTAGAKPLIGQFFHQPSGSYVNSGIVIGNVTGSASPYTVTLTTAVTITSGSAVSFYNYASPLPTGGFSMINVANMINTASFTPNTTISVYGGNGIYACGNQQGNITIVRPASSPTASPLTTTIYNTSIYNSYSPVSDSLQTFPLSTYTLYAPTTFNIYPSYQYSNIGTYNTLTVPDGNYSISQLNTALQNYMKSKNHNLTQTSTGNNVYYISLSSSSITSSITNTNALTVSPIPATLPTGYTAPSGFPYSANQYTPVIQIPANNPYSFGQLIGFVAGYYPSTFPNTTAKTLYGTLVSNPPVTSLVIRCNLISNEVSNQTDILDVIPIANTSFGTDIVYQPSFEKWISLKNGVYDGFFIYIKDQNFNNIQALDPNSVFSLLIKNGKKIKRKINQTNPSKIQPLFSNEDI
jgi:hypothetical protein